jgi:hypothetical protein
MKSEGLKQRSEMETDLITAFARHGVVVSQQDIPVILHKGADAFLRHKSRALPGESMLELYLIISEIRTV